MEQHTCEVCGKPATVYVADVFQGEPAVDAKGMKWATWERRASWFCADHDRPGSVAVDSRQENQLLAYNGSIERAIGIAREVSTAADMVGIGRGIF